MYSDVEWTLGGQGGSGGTFEFDPSQLDPGTYTATAKCVKRPDISSSRTVNVIEVRIVHDYPKVLVNGKFSYFANGYPEGLFPKYYWSTAQFNGNVSMEEYSDGSKATFSVSEPCPKTSSGGTVSVTYGPTNASVKEQKITKLARFYTQDEMVKTMTSAEFRLDQHPNTGFTLFEHIYRYFLYDQFNKPIGDSHQGYKEPMVKETFGQRSAPLSPSLEQAIIKATDEYAARGWTSTSNSQFGDSVRMSLYNSTWRIPSGDFNNRIDDNEIAFEVRDHEWWGSISGEHSEVRTNNLWRGRFINVQTEEALRDGVIYTRVSSFQIESTYVINYR